MSTVGVAQLKAALSLYLARVKAGEEVVVTERGRPVARLVPVQPAPGAEQARLQALERAGEVRVGSGKVPETFWELPRPQDARGLVRLAVAEEREQGW